MPQKVMKVKFWSRFDFQRERGQLQPLICLF